VNGIFSLTRTNPQGKPAVGFGVILIVTGLIIFGGLYVLQVIRLPQRKDPTVKVTTPNSQNTRRGVGSPVEQTLRLRDQLPETHPHPGQSLETQFQRYMQDQATNQAAMAVPEKQPKPAEAGREDWIPKFDPKRLPPLHSPNGKLTANPIRSGGVEDKGAKSELDDGTIFFADQLLLFTNVQTAVKARKTGYEVKRFLPRGQKIPILLLSKINTAVGSMPVQMAVAKDVEFNGKLQLPFGWHLMGTGNQGPNHKVNVRVNTIVDPQGKEYPITAMVLSLEQEPGFDGYATESPLMLELLPLASTTVKTFMDALKDVTTQQSVIPSGNTTIVGSQQTYALNAKSKLLDGTAQVLSGIMADKAKELNALYPQGTIVPRGTLGWALLTAPLDLTLGKEGGSAEFLDKQEANPAPNVITLSQQQGAAHGLGTAAAAEMGSTPSSPVTQFPPGVQAMPNLSGVPAQSPSASPTKPLE
jgi:hypothetical protein